MRTLVVSDLHLGATSGVDLLRRADMRRPLVAAAAEADRVVILGDGLELREIPVRAAAAVIAPLLGELGEALGPEGSIVLAAGNHDHGMLGGWAERHLMQEPPHTMGLEQRIEPAEAGPLGALLERAARPAALAFAYPGLWLREDVYALHGHYLDLHTTVPTFERLAAGMMLRTLTPLPDGHVTPDDYEAVLAPLYAWMFALAQRSENGVVRAGSRSSARAWVALAGEGRARRPVRGRALSAGFATAVAALNALGLGPLRAELTGEALRQGYLDAMREAVRRLQIDARHVVFGHTHRSGPWPRDDDSEWVTDGGTRLMNTGSWVYQRHFITGEPGESPYWPGTAVLLDDDGPPRLVGLLTDRSRQELKPAQG